MTANDIAPAIQEQLQLGAAARIEVKQLRIQLDAAVQANAAYVTEYERMRAERDAALRLAALTAEQEAANAQVIVATRQMANDANARLRALLLTALSREDDGTTALTQYVMELIADRNGWRKAANTPGGA